MFRRHTEHLIGRIKKETLISHNNKTTEHIQQRKNRLLYKYKLAYVVYKNYKRQYKVTFKVRFIVITPDSSTDI